MTTANDIYLRALRRLNKVGVGQTPTAEQEQTMEDNLNSLHAYLIRNLYIDYDIEDIPEEDVDSMVTILAWRSRFDFSASIERMSALAGEMGEAWRVLFANNQIEDSGEPTPALYY